MSLREYIVEKMETTPKIFSFAGARVEQVDELPPGLDCQSIFKKVEDALPAKFLQGLKKVRIEDREDFKKRNLSALYDDDVLYISPNFSDDGSVFNDIIHEIAHHIETLYPGFIYDDGKIVHEFLKKRHEVEFELKTEGYWTEGYDFEDINYNEQLDHFLYKKVGPNMLRLVTTGSFIRPYAAVSVREYFATGFEAYYLGQKEKLDKISPMLYDKIYEMHHQENLT
jgi:hypothetical protein